jgi:RNA polymerase sigma-70 factor, ECF subfamily
MRNFSDDYASNVMNIETQKASLSLKALKSGDRSEFARLVEAHSAQIYRLALKMLGNAQDAEDVLQETFIKAFRKVDGFDGRSSISTWLFRIAMNEALMVLRRQQPETVSIQEPNESVDGEQEPLQIVDWCCLPEEELLSAEGQKFLGEAAQELSHSLRMVFLLRDVEGLSTRETAEVLNISETAVKTRLSRARLQLREKLTSYYSERMKGDKNDG